MDDDDEVHPLDRDYSVPGQPARKRRSDLSTLHRIGFSTFTAGFVTVVLAAIVLGAFPDVGWLETIGSFIHRLAMYFILIGGVLTLIAYSAPRRAAAAKEQERRRLERREPSTIGDAARAKDAKTLSLAPRSLLRAAFAGLLWAFVSLLPLAGLMGLIFGCDSLGGRAQAGFGGALTGIVLVILWSVFGLGGIGIAIAGSMTGIAAWFLTNNAIRRRVLTLILSVGATALLLWSIGIF